MQRVAEGWAKHILAYVQADDNERKEKKISKSSQLRMRELLELTMRVDQLLDMVMSSKLGWGKEQFEPVREAIEELNSKLQKYPSIIGVEYDSNFTSDPHFSERVSSLFYPASEGLVARYIFHLAEDRVIQNIKRCVCGKLFYGLREIDKSCSDLCRHKLYRQSEEYKQKRRDQAKATYQLHKAGKVKESNG